MLRDLKVSIKLVGAIGIVATTAAAAVGWVVFRDADQTVHAETVTRLEAERVSRARFVSTYFRRIRDDLLVASKLLVTQIALRDFPAAVANVGSVSDYDRLHALFHPIARGLVDAFGYHDVLLVGVDGTVLYTGVKEIDVATNLRTGPFRESGLAQGFTRAGSAVRGVAQFCDYR